jgi:hypothetical protein
MPGEPDNKPLMIAFATQLTQQATWLCQTASGLVDLAKVLKAQADIAP